MHMCKWKVEKKGVMLCHSSFWSYATLHWCHLRFLAKGLCLTEPCRIFLSGCIVFPWNECRKPTFSSSRTGSNKIIISCSITNSRRDNIYTIFPYTLHSGMNHLYAPSMPPYIQHSNSENALRKICLLFYLCLNG